MNKLNCKTIPGSEQILTAGNILMLGEIHGTWEGPEYTLELGCQALSNGIEVLIGLELPFAEESAIRNFIDSRGGEKELKKILDLNFWAKDYQDGRTSQAVLDLIKKIRLLKKMGHPINVFLIDDSSSSDRDQYMADRVISVANENPAHLILTLTGNYHTMVFEGSRQMGGLILNEFGKEKVTSLNMSYTGGSAWVDVAGEGFGPIGLVGHGKSEIGVYLHDFPGEYHGTLEVDSIHFSPPAKDIK